MRVSSLSDERIIDLVSRHFIPVWVSRDAYQRSPPDRAERDLLAHIDADRHRKRFEGGTVCVYVVTPDGDALATMTVQRACKPDLLAPFLKKIIADEKLSPRDGAAVKASAAAIRATRPATAGGRLFSVRARFDEAGPNRGTARDLVELTKEQWGAFLPPRAAEGAAWTIPRGTAEKLLRHAYPPVSHWDAKLARIHSCTLSARVVGPSRGEVVVRLEGKLDLVYPDKGKPDDGRLTARLVGYARADTGRRTLRSMELVSEEGRYVWYWQGNPLPRATSLAVELLP
jgi:hypothetical protein